MASPKDMNKKYVVLENVLNNINSRAISLQTKETKRNNIILNVVLDKIVELMKQKDILFNGLYKEKYYGGSFYDNLKVGNPNEYDLDLLLNLPTITNPCVLCTPYAGFVKVEIKSYDKILERPDEERIRTEKMRSFLDPANFLSTEKVLSWMEGIITKALSELSRDDTGTYIDAVLDRAKSNEVIRVYTKMTKGAPAFTLRLSAKDIDGSDIQLDIDLVPCFQFFGDNWPAKSGGYRPNPSQNKPRFLVVPKKPKEENVTNPRELERYWRLSFQEQERELITGDKMKVLKPSLKLLKKLRDKHDHNIASYFIKTIFLWTVEQEEVSFWSQSLSIVFMSMLKKYEERIRSNSIPYYWNGGYNLIGYLKDSTKIGIANTLRKIILDVDRNLDDPIDPFVIGKYLLSKEEFEKLKQNVKLSKKQEKQLQFSFTKSVLNSSSFDVPDSAGPSISPLVQLGFNPGLQETLKQYSDTLEVTHRQLVNSMTANETKSASSTTEVLSYLKKIDDKMDSMLEKFNKVQEDNRSTNENLLKVTEKVRLLEIENRNLRSRLDERNSRGGNSIDDLLNIRQIENSGDRKPDFA